MVNNIHVGFIGFGNMGKAIAQGWLKTQTLTGSQIVACAKHYDPLKEYCDLYGVQACRNASEVVKQCDVIILAVKPNLIESVCMPIKEDLQHKLVISVAAGLTYEFYEKILASHTSHISMIPNTPIAVAEGVCIVENKHSLNESQWVLFQQLFEPISLIEMVDTSLLSIAGTISGCGPAFTAMMIEALGDAGVKYGLPRNIVYRLVSQMIVGTGKLQLATQKHPAIIKDEVCSPKGTTIQGVSELEEKGFRSALISAIDAIEDR